MTEREAQKTDDAAVGAEDGTAGFAGDSHGGENAAVDVGNVAADDTGVDAGFEESAELAPQSDEPSSGGVIRSLYDRTLGRVLSSRGVVVAVALTVAFSMAFSLIPFVGLLGNILGIGVAGFVYGLGSDNRRYLELLLAGALVGSGAAVLGNLLVITFGSMTGLLGVGLFGGALAATLGHYFGRDFRDGLTRDVE